MNIWHTILDAFGSALIWLHDIMAGLFGDGPAWGWAIIALTVLVRLLLLPLAVKQTRSMRAMQQLQPKIKELQKKHKVDRELLKKDPETYRKRKQKLNEEMMALYKEEGVNPAAGCLPLLLQAPIFIALFRVLDGDTLPELATASFYFFTQYVEGLGANVSAAGWPGWLLIFLMVATMFWSQRQMMARTQAEGMQAQQQKIMMYVMPIFLGGISLNFPMGVLLYWVTTNFWQMGQQFVILKEVQHELAEEAEARKKGGRVSQKEAKQRPGPSGNGTPDKKKPKKQQPQQKKQKDEAPQEQESARNQPKKRKRDHLPRRGEN